MKQADLQRFEKCDDWHEKKFCSCFEYRDFQILSNDFQMSINFQILSIETFKYQKKLTGCFETELCGGWPFRQLYYGSYPWDCVHRYASDRKSVV